MRRSESALSRRSCICFVLAAVRRGSRLSGAPSLSRSAATSRTVSVCSLLIRTKDLPPDGLRRNQFGQQAGIVDRVGVPVVVEVGERRPLLAPRLDPLGPRLDLRIRVVPVATALAA